MIFLSGVQTLHIQTCSSSLLVILESKEKVKKSLTTGIYCPGQGTRELNKDLENKIYNQLFCPSLEP